MSNILLTDVSLNPQLKIGLGAFLFIPESILMLHPDDLNQIDFADQIITKKFENTSSTKLEIETVIWAIKSNINSIKRNNIPLKIYSDSQCVCGLLSRKDELQERNYIAKSSGNELKNSELYKEFYKLQEELNFDVVKVKGHSPRSGHNTLHRIFSFLDSHVRSTLKIWI